MSDNNSYRKFTKVSVFEAIFVGMLLVFCRHIAALCTQSTPASRWKSEM
jgi:hypothetical protein